MSPLGKLQAIILEMPPLSNGIVGPKLWPGFPTWPQRRRKVMKKGPRPVRLRPGSLWCCVRHASAIRLIQILNHHSTLLCH
jgi:hypothetical protein